MSWNTIQSKLGNLRSAIKRWLVFEGLNHLIILAITMSVISFAADRLFRMDRPQRMLALFVALGVFGFTFRRRLLAPLWSGFSNEQLCLKLERHFPALSQSLITSFHFTQAVESGTVSNELVQCSIAQGIAAAAPLEFTEAIDQTRQKHNLFRIVGILLFVVAISAAFPGTTKLWFQRNILLGNQQWPQRTRLRVVGAKDGKLRVPFGNKLELKIEAEGVIPSSVSLRYTYMLQDKSGNERLALLGKSEFHTIFKTVEEPIRLRISGGDCIIDQLDILPIPRPEIKLLQGYATPPAYTGLPKKELPQNSAGYQVLNGSSIELTGQVNKKLSAASLVVARADKKEANVIQARVDGGSFRLTIPSSSLRSCRYQLRIADLEDLGPKEPIYLDIRLLPDRAPRVRAALEGIGSTITANASLPLSYRAKDDHGVKAVHIAAVLTEKPVEKEGAEEAPKRTERKLPLQVAQPKKLINDGAVVETAEMKLKEGMTLALQVIAEDTNTVDGPGVGSSETFTLRVVSKQELLKQLHRREQELRREFEQIVATQESLTEKARIHFSKLAKIKRPQLQKIEKQQRLLTQPCMHVSTALTAILTELRNNHLDEEAKDRETRLQHKLIEPIQELSNKLVPDVATAFDLTTNADSDKQFAERMKVAVDKQLVVTKTMRAILASMVEWEGYQEVVNLLEDLIDSQRKLRKETETKKKEGIEGIFN